MDDLQFNEELPPFEEETTESEIDVLDGAREYACLYSRRKALEAEVDEIKARMTLIEAEISEKMLFENPRLRVKIGEKASGEPIFKTVHVQTTVRASHAGDKQALVDAMKHSGLIDLVSETFNANTLSAYIRGLDPDKRVTTDELLDMVPEEMKPHIKLTRVVSLGCKA